MKLTRSSVLFISSANLGAVTGATGLAKRELLSLPDPLAVVVIDGEQACSTSVARRTLSPVWNESFDLWVLPSMHDTANPTSKVCISSMIAIQGFDHKKYRKQDQGMCYDSINIV